MDRVLFELEHLLPEIAVDMFVYDRGSGSLQVVACVGHGCVLAAGGGRLEGDGEEGEGDLEGLGWSMRGRV